MNANTEIILTIVEMANYLKISPSTAWRWCKQNRIPAFQIGRSWRIKQTDLDMVIEQNKAGYQKRSQNIKEDIKE